MMELIVCETLARNALIVSQLWYDMCLQSYRSFNHTSTGIDADASKGETSPGYFNSKSVFHRPEVRKLLLFYFYFFLTWSWKIIPYLLFYFFSNWSWEIIP